AVHGRDDAAMWTAFPARIASYGGRLQSGLGDGRLEFDSSCGLVHLTGGALHVLGTACGRVRQKRGVVGTIPSGAETVARGECCRCCKSGTRTRHANERIHITLS